MKKPLPLFSMLTVAAVFAGNCGCGGGASSSSPTPVLPIIVFASQGRATVDGGGTRSVTATVGHDSADRGVTWSVSCRAPACGAISPTSTASGASTTYTAPTPPAADLPVILTATSVSDSTKFGSASLTVQAILVSVSPSTATIQGATQFAATVNHDLNNGGVTWTVSCSAAPCGIVSPAATASGAAITYTPPTPLP